MSTLQSIRNHIATLPAISPAKQAVRDWLATSAPTLQYGVTLTLKQHTQRSAIDSRINQNGYKSYVKLDEYQAAAVASNYIKRLNQQLLRSAATRFNRSMFFLPILEGRGTDERLHLHFGIGETPKWCTAPDFYKAAMNAAQHTDWVDTQIDVLTADAFLTNYLTKSVARNNTDAVLWQCIPEAERFAHRS